MIAAQHCAKDQQLISASENIVMLEGQIDSIDIQNAKVSAEKRRIEGHHRQIRNMLIE
jgi:hypothetical protein